MLEAYLSAQASSLSAFVINKTHIVAQKPCRRHLNAKVCGSKGAIFGNLCSDHLPNNDNSNGSSTHLDFSTKLMLIIACSFSTTRCLHNFKFTLVNKSHLQHSVVAVCCEGHHFQILYTCAQEISFPGQIPRSLVWERH